MGRLVRFRAFSPTVTSKQDGSTEAINALLKKVKEVGHGFRNLDDYQIRLLLAAGAAWRTSSGRLRLPPAERPLTTLHGPEPRKYRQGEPPVNAVGRGRRLYRTGTRG